MKGKELIEKMTYVDDDLIAEAENALPVARSSHLFAKMATVAACACLVAGGMLLAGKSVSNPTEQSTGEAELSVVTPDASGSGAESADGVDASTAEHEVSYVTSSESRVIYGSGVHVGEECLDEWHGKTVCYCLSEVMENADENDIFAIRMYVSADMSYVYNGKTLEQYDIERGELALLFEKLSQLLKEGEDLKYGEALCTTGNADGTRWAESYYNERIAYYGEELLSEYIVNGEFLVDKLQADYEKACEAAFSEASPEKIAYRDALFAYMTGIAESIKGCLPSYVERGNGYVDIFMTRALFEELSTDGMPDCWFHIAPDNDTVQICE